MVKETLAFCPFHPPNPFQKLSDVTLYFFIRMLKASLTRGPEYHNQKQSLEQKRKYETYFAHQL